MATFQHFEICCFNGDCTYVYIVYIVYCVFCILVIVRYCRKSYQWPVIVNRNPFKTLELYMEKCKTMKFCEFDIDLVFGILLLCFCVVCILKSSN